EALYRRAEILDDLDRREEAATAYRAVVARYPSREVGAKARWRLGWLAWLAGDARGAAEEWTRLTGRGVDSAYRIVALYWAGRACGPLRRLRRRRASRAPPRPAPRRRRRPRPAGRAAPPRAAASARPGPPPARGARGARARARARGPPPLPKRRRTRATSVGGP